MCASDGELSPIVFVSLMQSASMELTVSAMLQDVAICWQIADEGA
jgi:hypothetical protein